MVLSLSVLALVLGGILISSYHYLRSAAQTDEFALQLGVISAQMGPLIAQAHMSGDEILVRNLLQSLFSFPALSCVDIMDGSGQMLASWPPQGCAYLDPQPLPENQVSLPVAGTELTMKMGIDTAYATEMARRSTLLFAGFSLAMLAGVGVLAFILVRWFVMRPLLMLKSAMQASRPDSPVLAREVRDDELGQAVRAYNRLAAAARVFFNQLRAQEQQLAEANRNFGDSVTYASRFQHQLLAREDEFPPVWGHVRLIWQPRDMVGGDFLRQFNRNGTDYIVFFDCTGHGVPGAFMVMIVSNVIDRIALADSCPSDPDDILSEIHHGVCNSLGLASGHTGRDGLDCAVLRLDDGSGQLGFSGAGIDLFELSDTDGLVRHRGSETKLGYQNSPLSSELKTHLISTAGSCFILMTDGLTTQIGAEKQQMLGHRRMMTELEALTDAPCSAERCVRHMMRVLRLWQGSEERRDDVMMLAFRPDARHQPDDNIETEHMNSASEHGGATRR